jgi:hypothetical protein
VSTGHTCEVSGEWTKISATATSFTVDYDSSINLTACDSDSTVTDYCVMIEVGYASACGVSYTTAIEFNLKYSGLCKESEWVVKSDLTTFYIDANVVAQDALEGYNYNENYWETSDVEFTFEASYLDAPTFHNEFNNESIPVVEDGTAFTIRQNVKNTARDTLRDSCTQTVAQMADGMDMNAGSLSNGECESLQFGDCFELDIKSKTYACGGTPTYDTAQDMTFDNDGNYWSYLYGSGVDCPLSNELCCLSFELDLALAETPSNGCTSANGNTLRRLSSPNARYLEDSIVDKNRIATLVHTIHVVRAGDGAFGEEGSRGAGNNKSDSGVAGWIPAAGVGGLLLLAGAVIAVTRRPSLLRGAFHGPTKVLPNEEK